MQQAADQQLATLQKQHPNQPDLRFELCMFLQFTWQAMVEHRRAHRRAIRTADAEGDEEAEQDIERACKAEDDADAETFRRMEEQKQVPRPLVFKAKCSAAKSSSSPPGPLPRAAITSCTAQFATDAEMIRAQQDNKVRMHRLLPAVSFRVNTFHQIVSIQSSAESAAMGQEIQMLLGDLRLQSLIFNAVSQKIARERIVKGFVMNFVAAYSFAGLNRVHNFRAPFFQLNTQPSTRLLWQP